MDNPEAELKISEDRRLEEIAKALENGRARFDKAIKSLFEITKKAEQDSKKVDRVLAGSTPS